jgi:hypothetical protein
MDISGMIEAIKEIDDWLDNGASSEYKEQPLAQDWARISKLAEEVGEAISEFILATGQNPRKGKDLLAEERMLLEMADVVWGGVLCIQHFTKNWWRTEDILRGKLEALHARVPDEEA